MERRTFLRGLAVAGPAASNAFAQQTVATQSSTAPAQIPRVSDPGELRGEMLYRKFGRTGQTVSAIGLGGSHIGKASLTQAEATRLIHQAIDRGITFMDNCWDYNEGRSERWMGEALAQGGYRQAAFHWLYRAQRSACSPAYAGSRCEARLSVRRGAHAFEPDGCALPELCSAGDAETGRAEDRNSDHEAILRRGRHHSQKRCDSKIRLIACTMR